MQSVRERVTCGGEFHPVVLLRNGHLTFPGHQRGEVANWAALAELGGPLPYCAEVLRLWRDGSTNACAALPGGLRRARALRRFAGVPANQTGPMSEADCVAATRWANRLILARPEPVVDDEELSAALRKAASSRKSDFCRLLLTVVAAEMTRRRRKDGPFCLLTLSPAHTATGVVCGYRLTSRAVPVRIGRFVADLGWSIRAVPNGNLLADVHLAVNNPRGDPYDVYHVRAGRNNVRRVADELADTVERLWLRRYVTLDAHHKKELREKQAVVRSREVEQTHAGQAAPLLSVVAVNGRLHVRGLIGSAPLSEAAAALILKACRPVAEYADRIRALLEGRTSLAGPMPGWTVVER